MSNGGPSNLNSPETFLRSGIPAGSRLRLRVRSIIAEAGERFVRFVSADAFDIRYLVYNDDEYRTPWCDILECEWIPRPDELDPRYADGRPPPGP
jgi:hypothetical protein